MKIGALLSHKNLVVHLCIAMALLLSGCASSPEAKSAKHLAAGKALLQKKDAARAILEFKTAAQATPKNAETHYQLALAYLANGDLGRGVASLRKALELNPKHTAAQLRLAQLMTGADDPTVLEDAQKRLQALLLETPESGDALHALALTELKLRQPESALQHLKQALVNEPQDLKIVATLAVAKITEKDFKGAEEVFKEACLKSPKSADAAFLFGRFYLILNKSDEAQHQFERAISLNPNYLPALLNLATLRYQMGKKLEAEQIFKQLSQQSDKQFNGNYGIFLFQEGRRGEAVQEFQRLAKKDPDDRMSRTRLIAAYLTMNRAPDAQKLLNDALNKNPKDLNALLQRGEIFLHVRMYPEAEADLNSVLHLEPAAPEVHYALSKLYEARGAKQMQRAELNETLRLSPFLLPVRLEMARSLIADGAGGAALSVLAAAPNVQKSDIRLIEQQNWALLSAGQTGEARKAVDLGLASVRTVDLLLQDAVLKIGAKRYPEARQSIHEALLSSPEDLRSLRLLAGSYAAQGQMRGAVEEVKEYANHHPKSAVIQYFWGSLLIETGDRAGAKRALASAKAINPDYAPADLSLARVDLLQANWKDARQELTTILSSKGDSPLARQWLGMLEVSIGDRAAAVANFRRVIESEPNNLIALNNLAFLLAESGNQTEEPLKYAQKAVELDPGNPELEDTLGWVLYRRGVYDLAVKHLELSISKRPTALRNYHLAMAYYKAGKADRGRLVLNTALRMDSSLPEAKLARDTFQASSESATRRK